MGAQIIRGTQYQRSRVRGLLTHCIASLPVSICHKPAVLFTRKSKIADPLSDPFKLKQEGCLFKLGQEVFFSGQTSPKPLQN